MVVAVFSAGNAGCDINEMASAAAANIWGTVYLDFIIRFATRTAGGAVHLTICNSGLETTLSFVVVQGTEGQWPPESYPEGKQLDVHPNMLLLC